MNRIRIGAALLMAALAGSLSCSSSPTEIQIGSVSVSLSSTKPVVGQTLSASAVVRDVNGLAMVNPLLEWSSSNASIASVTVDGSVTAMSAGTAQITATSSGVTGSAPLTVVVPTPGAVASVSVALGTSSLNAGQTTQATATTRDASNNVLTGRVIVWTSNNPAVATVSGSGVVTAVAAGSAQITATSEGVAGSAGLSVGAPPPPPVAVASVSVTLTVSSLNAGQTTQATATTRDASNNVLTGRVIVWTSSNPAVATVSGSGVVTAVAAGSAQITATSEGVAGSAGLSVTAPPPPPVAVASVSVTLTVSSLNPGQTTQATATTRDASNNVLTGRVIVWTSSNPAVAMVSGSGVVTAVAAGSAQITATSEGKSGSAGLSVVAPPPVAVASVGVTLASGSLNPGQTTQATATTRDVNNNILTGRVIVWTSTNPAVATVNSSSGLVTAVAVGSAQITATSEGVNGSAALSVVAPPPPPPPGTVEPPGMTVITERSFSAIAEDSWTVPTGTDLANFTVVPDLTAPKSSPSVLQIRFPAGFGAGGSPALTERDLGSTASTLYVSMWIKLSSNWVGQMTGTNKVLHFWMAGLNRLFVYIDGSGANILQPYVGLQGIATPYNDGAGSTSTSVNLRPNVPGQTGAQIVRGQWYHWELVFAINSSGGTDGSADWWVNGVQVGHYTGIGYVSSSQSRVFQTMKWDPTWGGLGGSVPADQFMTMDHIYISGKP
jgi:uncharacterized protein YjdB